MTNIPQRPELLEHLAHLEPQVSRVLWESFDHHRPTVLSRPLQDKRGISRQAASQLLFRLVKSGLIVEGPGIRPKTYLQQLLFSHELTFQLKGLEEHVVWSEHFRPMFSRYMGAEALNIWEYGFTEMLNNAVEHSQGTEVKIHADVRGGGTSVWMADDGEGIFKRITRLCKLIDERQAILELAKGKLTTDPDNHSGEGVFFAARAFDMFRIVSGGLTFDHKEGEEDFLFERDMERPGTLVWMEHGNHTERDLKAVFDEFAVPDEFTFSKTVIPVRLGRFGEEGLVSRSQAQRLLARADRFKVVLFDFTDVETVGQAFADEIFRVYAKAHPEVDLTPVRASTQVQQMIVRATSAS